MLSPSPTSMRSSSAPAPRARSSQRSWRRRGRRSSSSRADARCCPPDMISSDIHSRSLHWGGGEAELELASPAIRTYFSTGAQTGGTAAHHYAAWFRLHDEDFHMKSTFGQGNDWPIGYADLRPYYDRIQEEVGISGGATSGRAQYARVQGARGVSVRRLVRRGLPDRSAGKSADDLSARSLRARCDAVE